MKLRLKNNAIRLRLSPRDVDHFSVGGSVEEHLAFGPEAGQRFVYVLEASEEVSRLTASYEPGRLVVRMPAEWARDWSANDRVGFEGAIGEDEAHRIQVLVEKDFDCLHRNEGGPPGSAFPNPSEKRSREG